MGSWRRVISGASSLVLRKWAPPRNSWKAASRWAPQSSSTSSILGEMQWRPFFQGHRMMSTPTSAPENVPCPEDVQAKPENEPEKQQAEELKASEVEKQEAPQAEELKVSEVEKQAQEPTTSKWKPIRPSWLSFALMVVTGALLLYYYDREKKRQVKEFTETTVKYGPAVGKAAIGGPFKLINHEGKVVTENDFTGDWTLIYFGFTSCPDICPEELQKMIQALDIIEKKKVQVNRLFISVDPERDTVDQMREYIKEFDPKLVGLTGTPEDIKKVAKSFRVYYMKTGDPGDEDYLVDHSIIMYLMDKDMEFVKFFGKDYTAAELADGILKEIKNYKKAKEVK